MERDALSHLVLDCLHDVLDEMQALPAAPLTAETRLLGREAVLDSLGLVRLILEVEERLAEAHDLNVTLADERAMSQARSPFRSVATLVDYIVELSSEGGPDGGQ